QQDALNSRAKTRANRRLPQSANGKLSCVLQSFVVLYISTVEGTEDESSGEEQTIAARLLLFPAHATSSWAGPPFFPKQFGYMLRRVALTVVISLMLAGSYQVSTAAHRPEFLVCDGELGQWFIFIDAFGGMSAAVHHCLRDLNGHPTGVVR